jgi:hypothetical protein
MNLRPYIGDVDAAAIATGALGRTIGNKVYDKHDHKVPHFGACHIECGY